MGSHLPPGALPFPLTAPPAQERPAELPSFLQEAHPSRAGSSPAATQWPLSAAEPGTETQRTPSLTYFLFPPSGSGLGPERPYPDCGQEEGKHSPFPSRLSVPAGLTAARLGGFCHQKAEGGAVRGKGSEDLGGRGRWACQGQACSTKRRDRGPLDSVALEMQPQGLSNHEVGRVLLLVFVYNCSFTT